MSSSSLQDDTGLQSFAQNYGDDPLAARESDLYRGEFVTGFVEKWDELIDWDARTKAEGQFFIDVLRAHGKESVLDAATGTGFHSVRLTEAGFDFVSVDGSAAMLAKAFENGRKRGLILKTVQADWRELNRAIHGKYDAIICLGNSFTHLHDEQDRRKALAEFYAALRHDGILILDQRNYDEMLDHGFTSKHKYYYCGDKVTAEPEYIDDGLARFKYTFPDGCEYTLNMFPLRKNYVRRLMREAGFERRAHVRRLPGDLPGERARLLHPRCGEVCEPELPAAYRRSPYPYATTALGKVGAIAGDAMVRLASTRHAVRATTDERPG